MLIFFFFGRDALRSTESAMIDTDSLPRSFEAYHVSHCAIQAHQISLDDDSAHSKVNTVGQKRFVVKSLPSAAMILVMGHLYDWRQVGKKKG